MSSAKVVGKWDTLIVIVRVPNPLAVTKPHLKQTVTKTNPKLKKVSSLRVHIDNTLKNANFER